MPGAMLDLHESNQRHRVFTKCRQSCSVMFPNTALLRFAAAALCGERDKSQIITRVVKLAQQNGQAP